MESESAPEFPKCSHAQKKVRRPRPNGFALIASEPFRVFFPAGILAGAYGVLLWPMLYAGWLRFYPGVPHARLMVGGFLAAFVIGFLGTALPRMLTAPRIQKWEMAGLLGLFGVAVYFQGTGRVAMGDVFLFSLLFAFTAGMSARWIFFRKEHPPAGFVVAYVGLLCGLVGIGIQAFGANANPGGALARVSSLLLYQGFTVLPVLGIGSFLAPRFFDGGNGPKGKGRAFAVGAAAVLILVAIAVEAAGVPRWANGIRVVVVFAYFFGWTGVFSRTGTRGSLTFAFQISVWSLLASFAFGVIRPDLRIGVEHIAFVSGFGLLALTVAARVTLGHSGNSGLFFARNRPMRWVVGLVIVAMTTRVSADFFPKIMVSHHIYGAALWVSVVVIWLIWLGPKFFAADPDED